MGGIRVDFLRLDSWLDLMCKWLHDYAAPTIGQQDCRHYGCPDGNVIFPGKVLALYSASRPGEGGESGLTFHNS